MNKLEPRELLDKHLALLELKPIRYNRKIYQAFLNALDEAINYTHCCETLKVKDLMTFDDYKNNLFIKKDGVYQPKKTKLFRWYSEKQLKKMYKDKPL